MNLKKLRDDLNNGDNNAILEAVKLLDHLIENDPSKPRRVFVMTDTQLGWDCVTGVFNSMEEIHKEYLTGQYGYTSIEDMEEKGNIISDMPLRGIPWPM